MKMVTMICGNCGTEFEKPSKEIARQRRRGRTVFYCCQSCATIKTRTTHSNVERACKWCKKTFISTSHKRHKTCCCIECARKYSQSKVDTKKIASAISILHKEGNAWRRTSNMENRPCKVCGATFSVPVWKKKSMCSRACYHVWRSSHSRKVFERRVKNGTWVTWRKNTEPSYPERFFMKVLESNHVPFEYERPFGRYSIDFAINDQKIALEIDGQQHRFSDRAESDKRKDAALISEGWRVVRIVWKSPRTVDGKRHLKSEIERFLNIYKGCGNA